MKGILSLLTFQRYVQFGIVGCGGILVDMGALFLLADPKILAINLYISKALAAEIALLNNFAWNEFWTFRDISAIESHWRARMGRLVKFNLICLFGIGLSILLLNLEVRWFGMNVYIGNLIAILISSLWNFGMNVKFGWNKRAQTVAGGISGHESSAVVIAG